jgi:hypothetical protein
MIDGFTSRSDALAAGLLSLACGLLFAASESARYGDSIAYAVQLQEAVLIEPGHLLWRPLAYAVANSISAGGSASSFLWVLQFVSLSASVLGVAATYFLVRRLLPALSSIALAGLVGVSNGYWAYAFSGCSYSLGYLFLCISLLCLLPQDGGTPSGRRVLVAGVCGGLSVSAWGANVIVAPALWLLAVLRSRHEPPLSLREIVRPTLALALGAVLSFALPLSVLLALRHSIGLEHFTNAAALEHSVFSWVRTVDHGIPLQFGLDSLLRVALGWPQSFLALSDLGPQLRLWRYGDGPFPSVLSLAGLAAFYAMTAAAAVHLLSNFHTLSRGARSLLWAGALAIGLNLAFALTWQGTDLERYFPSLPFQILLLALCIHQQRLHQWKIAGLALTFAVLVAWTNWSVHLRDLLAPSGYRQTWIRAIADSTSHTDVVVVLGNRKFSVNSPHDPDFPRVENVSYLVAAYGSGWRRELYDRWRRTVGGTGRLLVADSVLASDDGPRDGWSFREHPNPTPGEIASAFVIVPGVSPVFSANGERVWLAEWTQAHED